MDVDEGEPYKLLEDRVVREVAVNDVLPIDASAGVFPLVTGILPDHAGGGCNPTDASWFLAARNSCSSLPSSILERSSFAASSASPARRSASRCISTSDSSER